MTKRIIHRLKTTPPRWARIVQIIVTLCALIVREWDSLPIEWKAAIPGEEIKPLIYVFIVIAVLAQMFNKKQIDV